MSERWGRVAFAMIVGGFNLGFFPMHLLGLMGMPRRVYTYPAGMGWDGLNQVATAGSAIAVAGGLVFVGNARGQLLAGRAVRSRSVGRIDAGMGPAGPRRHRGTSPILRWCAA